jgi:RNA polymerase sigma-70 factor (ECF subfamily)
MTNSPIPPLFRTEYGKIVAVLVRSFGIARVGEAEDIASDTFLLAAETWGTKGLPANPTGWLYVTAKNRARDRLRREGVFATKIQPELQRAETTTEPPEPDFSPAGFNDSQLRMIFALCHPELKTETQVALCLRILCGFGIAEIAGAFLTTKSTINKRLTRGKTRLRGVMTDLELPGESVLPSRLEGVLTTIYLLFNEGYYATGTAASFRRDLCADAIRLALLLTKYERTNQPRVNALLALMCFQASRFDARLSAGGELIDYDDQDRALWDERLVSQGRHFLERATAGGETGRYQLEAAIAFLHTSPKPGPEKWPNILALYNRLLILDYSPVAALNRTYAFSRVHGPEAALAEALKIDLRGHLGYQLLLGELYRELGERRSAREHFELALGLTLNPAVRRRIGGKLAGL